MNINELTHKMDCAGSNNKHIIYVENNLWEILESENTILTHSEYTFEIRPIRHVPIENGTELILIHDDLLKELSTRVHNIEYTLSQNQHILK